MGGHCDGPPILGARPASTPGQQTTRRRGPDGRVEQALTRLAWRDDSQIVAWHAYKHYATTDHPVGAQITIQELRR